MNRLMSAVGVLCVAAGCSGSTTPESEGAPWLPRKLKLTFFLRSVSRSSSVLFVGLSSRVP